MRDTFFLFIHDTFFVRLLKLYGILIFSFILVSLLGWRNLPPQIPLYYSLPRGGEQLGNPVSLLLLPVLSLIVFILHFYFALMIYSTKKLAAQLLFIISLVISLLFLITFVKIIFLVT